MKKLMVALAAVAVGLAAQAAIVDWQYSVQGVDTTVAGYPDYNSGYTLYLVDAAAFDNVEKVTADTFKDSSITYGSTTFAAGTGKKASAKTFNSIAVGKTEAGLSATTLSDDIITKGGTHDFYYVIVDDNADKYIVSDKATLTGRGTTDSGIGGNALATTQAAIDTKGWKSFGGGDVPEPTSGLLLLLGVAGLALRRKQK